MSNLIEVRLFDPNDKKIDAFRREVYSQDLGVNPTLVDTPMSHSHCAANFKDKNWEEIYKYGTLKWNQTQFDGILGALNQEGSVVSISGFRQYGNFLRVGMHLYTLKEFRARHRSLLWCEDGFIDFTNHLDLDQTIDGRFISIYPHNKALIRWSKRLSNSKNFAQMGNSDPSVLEKMQSFIPLEDLISFNGVDQKIFYQNTSDSISDAQLQSNLLSALESY